MFCMQWAYIQLGICNIAKYKSCLSS